MSWNTVRHGNVNCPCQGCKDREVGCHGKCEKYKEYKKEIEDYKTKKGKSYATAKRFLNTWLMNLFF